MIGNAKTIIEWLYDEPKGKIYEIKEKKNKRSLDQNSYSWVLQGELSKKLTIPLQEVHFNMLKSYGAFEVVSVLENVNLNGYFKYYEVFGISKLNGKVFKHVRVYKPTSEMNTLEMTHFIDGVIQECQNLGIPTLTEEQVRKMRLK